MSPYELLLAMKDYCEGDAKETIEQCNDLLGSLLDSKAFLVNFSNEIEEFALNNNCCPNCGEELRTVQVGEEFSEYFGREVGENIYEKVCDECNYISD